jgi:hypothetical protein
MKRFTRLGVAAVLAALATINVVAFMQARAMTQFAAGGGRTARPEELGFLDTAAVIISGVRVPRPQNTRTPAALNLPFETFRFSSGNGAIIEAWYIPGESKRLVVALFHGYGASKSTLLHVASALHELGYATLLVDFYGSGGSSGNHTTVGVEEAHDVAAAANFIRRKWPARKVALYGVSMGGAAVLRAIASHGTRADGIIIESVFDTLLNTAKSRFNATGLPATPLAELLIFWGSVQRGFNFFAHNPVDYARSVNSPALILHGEKDERAPPAQAGAVARAMGRHARLVVYQGVPHMAIVDARRFEWLRVMGEFLRGVS